MKHFYQSSGCYEKFIPAMRRVSPSYEAYYQKLLAADEMEQKHLKMKEKRNTTGTYPVECFAFFDFCVMD